mmetsp:Transcript_30302/g.85474  ORF Transcript_30302/g.85474 Transcript_30302/m.85474 type:complete len:549 (-) Transcript_30302:90-1736(-)
MYWRPLLLLLAAIYRGSQGSYCEWHLDYFYRRKINYTDEPWSFSIDPGCTSLSCMTMLWGSIDDRGAAALAAALAKAPQLEELTLGYNNIGDSGAAAIAAALKHLPRLRLLFFGWNGIGNAGASALAAALEHAPRLEELNLFWNFLGEAGTAALAAALAHTPRLAKLNLAWNNMGDAGAVALAEALKKTPGVTELSVAWSGVGNLGATALASALVHLPKLKELRMRGNDFGDVGATALAEAVLSLEASREGERLVSSGIPWAIMESVRAASTGASSGGAPPASSTAPPPLGGEAGRAAPLRSDAVTCRRQHCHALVVGNANYTQGGQLVAAVRQDAHDMAATLGHLGFDVVEVIDGSQKKMQSAAKAFFKKVEADAVALVYFAGRGLQHAGSTYVLPVDYAAKPGGKLDKTAVATDSLLKSLGLRAAVGVLIVDACQPGASQVVSDGLAPAVVAPVNTVLALAAAPGAACQPPAAGGASGEEPGKAEARSPYTRHLLAQLSKKDLHIEQVFKRVRGLVAQETENRQIPWEASSLVTDFVFNPTTRSEL